MAKSDFLLTLPPHPQNLRALGKAQSKSDLQKELSSLELLNTLFRSINQEVSLWLELGVTRHYSMLCRLRNESGQRLEAGSLWRRC